MPGELSPACPRPLPSHTDAPGALSSAIGKHGHCGDEAQEVRVGVRGLLDFRQYTLFPSHAWEGEVIFQLEQVKHKLLDPTLGFLIQLVWGRACKFPFLTSSRVMMLLLDQISHCGKHWGSSQEHGHWGQPTLVSHLTRCITV